MKVQLVRGLSVYKPLLVNFFGLSNSLAVYIGDYQMSGVDIITIMQSDSSKLLFNRGSEL